MNLFMTYPVRNVFVVSQCKLLILHSEGKEIQNCIFCFFQQLLEKMISFFLQKVDLYSMFVLISISWSQFLSHPLSVKGIDDVGWLDAQKGI